MNLVTGLHPIELSVVSYWLQKDTVPFPRVSTTIINDHPYDKILRIQGRRLIYLQTEPEAIVACREFLLKNATLFHAIVTFDSVVLRHCPNAIGYSVGGCWIRHDEYGKANPIEKQFAISTLVGTKVWTEGHRFRGLLYTRQREITSIPYTFYRSTKIGEIPEITNNPLFIWDSKYELFRTYQYSIAIENSRQDNYFTEKLIDCFVTKTIPIYWGCPNIGHFFRTDGMIVLETATFEEFKAKIDTLTPDTYAAKRDAIEENYRRALHYVSVPANIHRAVKRIPEY